MKNEAGNVPRPELTNASTEPRFRDMVGEDGEVGIDDCPIGDPC